MKAIFLIEWDENKQSQMVRGEIKGFLDLSLSILDGKATLLPNEPEEYCTCEKFHREGFTVVNGKCTRCYKTVRPKEKPISNVPENIEWGEDIPIGLMQTTINQILNVLRTLEGRLTEKR